MEGWLWSLWVSRTSRVAPRPLGPGARVEPPSSQPPAPRSTPAAALGMERAPGFGRVPRVLGESPSASAPAVSQASLLRLYHRFRALDKNEKGYLR